MTVKESIVEAVECLPEECLDDLAHYVEALRQRAALRAANHPCQRVCVGQGLASARGG